MGLTKSINRAVRRSEEEAAVLEQNTLEVSTNAKLVADTQLAPASPAAVAVAIAVAPVEPQPQTADNVETLYINHRNLLLYVACRKFRIPECDAENLIQEVFLSYLQTGTKIDNIRAWLVAAICNASRHYWRAQGRTESLPDDFNDQSDPGSQGLAEKFAMQMTVRQALNYLQPRCRETLWLHYFEGRSAIDVARELETTNRYAEKLIHNCLKRVREIYISITAVKR